MATLEQLETALVNANKAGDMDAVRRLAVVVKSERQSRDDFNTDKATGIKLPAIPSQFDNTQVAGTTPAPPEPSIGQKVIGAGEAGLSAVTGATTGSVGMIGGFLKGLAQDVLSGKYGTQEGADTVGKSTEAGADALTYSPRTATGQEYAGKVGEAMQQVTPLIPMAGELAPIGESASAIKAIAKPAVVSAAQDAVAAVKATPIAQAATDLAQSVKAKITGVDPNATPGTGMSAGAAATDIATQRRTNAEALGFTGDKALTEGQATRDFSQQRFERETAKNPDIGEPIRQRMQNQNAHLAQKMDEFIDDTGAEMTDSRGVGEVVDKALRSRATRDKTKIRALYNEADKAGEMGETVDMSPVSDILKESESAKSLAPVLGATEQELNRLQGLSSDGQLSLGHAEQLRKFVNKVAGADPTNIKYAADIKRAIDAATEGRGGDLYQKARAARAQYANDYENFSLAKQLLNTKRGSTDRAIAMEDVLHKSVISPSASVDTVSKLKTLLQSEGESGQQAWKEIQGGVLRHIRDEALKGITTDSAGNKIMSPAKMEAVINQLDKTGKLDFVLGKKKADQIRTIRDVAKDILTAPPGSVNTSNTATVLTAMLDTAIGGSITGLPIPIPVASAVRIATSRIKDAKLRARVKQALGE